MGETKKVGSAGRFGSRYGVGIRRKLLKVESVQLQKNKCPNCQSSNVKRKSKGVFVCRKCSYEFVGGAYYPRTLTGTIISQMVSQKRFAPEMVATLSASKEAVASPEEHENAGKPRGRAEKGSKGKRHEEEEKESQSMEEE